MKDDILRIRCSFDGEFREEASYTLVMTAWEDRLDALLGKDRKRITPCVPGIADHEEYLSLTTDKLKVRVYRNPFGIDIFDKEGNLLSSDMRGKSYCRDQKGRVYHYQTLNEEDFYYAFGEKSGYLNKINRRLRMFNVDAFSYDPELSDPLYKHIPFYIKLDRGERTACGYFYNNSFPSVFDVGCERDYYWGAYSYYCADEGELDLFFIYGPDIKTVVKGYTDLTGKTALPPLYSLGYMGSSMHYTELEADCDQAVLSFAEKARKADIPCDGFHLSSGYTMSDDGKRYAFHWNHKKFPDPAGFIRRLRDKGLVLSPNIKPGMLVSHPLYRQFNEQGAFVLNNEGGKPYLDRFWGGDASFVDFSNPKARDLWKKYLKSSLTSIGVISIWNDNNEFEINDLEAICDFEVMRRSAGELKALLPNLMAKTAREAITELFPDTRPYILSRAGFSGIQRLAQTWAGDNRSDWKNLKYNIPLMLGMSLSGVANQGVDIGGFAGPAPEPELFVRWVQNAVFYPRFCIHSCNDDGSVTEPWMYEEYTEIIREAIKLRYRLAPYLYSLLYEASVEGSPVMRPLVYEFQQDANVPEESFDFMFGPFILVASVYEKGCEQRKVYLPEGCRWFDWKTREEYEGGRTITVDTPIDEIPMFFKSGSIIPMAKHISNLRLENIDTLNILIEPSTESEFVIYEDDGESNDYLKGSILTTTIRVKREDNEIVIRFESQGNYRTKVKSTCLDVIWRDSIPRSVRVAETLLNMETDRKDWYAEEQGWHYDEPHRSVRVKYDNPVGCYEVVISLV